MADFWPRCARRPWDRVPHPDTSRVPIEREISANADGLRAWRRIPPALREKSVARPAGRMEWRKFHRWARSGGWRPPRPPDRDARRNRHRGWARLGIRPRPTAVPPRSRPVDVERSETPKDSARDTNRDMTTCDRVRCTQAVALEVHDQALEVGVVLGADAGDRVGLAGHAPRLDDLGVAPEGVGDLVEQGAGRVEQLDQRLGVVAERVVVDDRGEALQRAAGAQCDRPGA